MDDKIIQFTLIFKFKKVWMALNASCFILEHQGMFKHFFNNLHLADSARCGLCKLLTTTLYKPSLRYVVWRLSSNNCIVLLIFINHFAIGSLSQHDNDYFQLSFRHLLFNHICDVIIMRQQHGKTHWKWNAGQSWHLK